MSGGHAHYVIVDGSGHRVWSRDRAAETLYHDLLRGPDRVIAFIREQRGGHRDHWMNSIWWQGVALLDLPARRLLVHTDQWIPGPDRHTSVLEVRAWLRLVAALWPGWTVTWAARGLHQVMDYLALPYDTVLYLDETPAPRARWAQAPAEDDLSAVADVLIAARDGERLSFGGWWAAGLAEPLLAGPGVLLTPQEEAVPFAALENVPWNGLYVDAPGRRLDWWSLDCSLDPRDLPARWPGWELTDHGDAFEEVAALIGPELLLDVDTEEEVFRRVAAWFVADAAPDGREALRAVAPP
ncbi:hypothetical protein ACIBF7_26800 [Nonomuraea sp. NPDC050478]|uniref:hypothetical protein n=1 Tax=unclassified Nonomuraea TaxID=2593643 RepID=UPI0011CDD960|nr:hypothetical protein [Nonomuraea sp. C10]TXK43263.1 hypothetical protein FR742_30085 [Nonomuraea sp. C10]